MYWTHEAPCDYILAQGNQNNNDKFAQGRVSGVVWVCLRWMDIKSFPRPLSTGEKYCVKLGAVKAVTLSSHLLSLHFDNPLLESRSAVCFKTNMGIFCCQRSTSTPVPVVHWTRNPTAVQVVLTTELCIIYSMSRHLWLFFLTGLKAHLLAKGAGAGNG